MQYGKGRAWRLVILARGVRLLVVVDDAPGQCRTRSQRSPLVAFVCVICRQLAKAVLQPTQYRHDFGTSCYCEGNSYQEDVPHVSRAPSKAANCGWWLMLSRMQCPLDIPGHRLHLCPGRMSGVGDAECGVPDLLENMLETQKWMCGMVHPSAWNRKW